MANMKNNGFWKLIIVIVGIAGTLISLGIIYETLNGGVKLNCAEITAIKPEVKKNTEYRLQAEIDGKYIKQQINEIKVIQKEILDEVRK